MFDIGWSELFIIGVIALIVIGPKDMPAAMRAAARVVSRLRGLSREFQSGMADLMREAELDDLKRKMDQAGSAHPDRFIKDHIDPSGSLTADFDPRQFNRAVMEGSLAKPPLPGNANGAQPPVMNDGGDKTGDKTAGDTPSDVATPATVERPKPASQ